MCHDVRSVYDNYRGSLPRVQLLKGRNSSVIVHQTWHQQDLTYSKNCLFEIYPNLIGDNDQEYKRGLFAKIKTINFRRDQNGQCVDFVQFIFPKIRTERMCGTMNATTESLLKVPTDSMYIRVFIDNSRPLSAWNMDSVHLQIVFVAYDSKLIFLLANFRF